jgi:hypothetical protein
MRVHPSLLRISTCYFLIILYKHVYATCQSYGVDFVDGGSYFININSPDYFSFVTEFDGMTSCFVT